MGADCRPITVAAGSLVTGQGGYAGAALHASGAAAAIVRIWDNASAASGVLLAVIELSASGAGSSVDHSLARPARFEKGLFVEFVSGTPEGSIRTT